MLKMVLFCYITMLNFENLQTLICQKPLMREHQHLNYTVCYAIDNVWTQLSRVQINNCLSEGEARG